MLAVHPGTQIVEWMLAWVTDGFSAPGVRARSGSTAPAALTTMPLVSSAPVRRERGRALGAWLVVPPAVPRPGGAEPAPLPGCGGRGGRWC